MATSTKRFSYSSRGDTDVIDVTGEVAEAVEQSGIHDGIVTVFIVGSTAGITSIENESGLIHDFREWMEKLAPEDGRYRHDHGPGSNAHSHLRASIIGASKTFPVEDGRLLLGTWQQIVLVDFDNRPRRRELVVTVVGE